MKLVTREGWGARKPKRTPDKFDGPLKGLTVHWEGPKMGVFSHDKCDDKVRGIQNYHMDTRKWNDIAYNWLACPHGYIFEGRGLHNASAANGFESVNETYLAVCYLGGQGDAFTDEAKAAILELYAYTKAPKLNGHRDHKSTECPGGIIYAWVQQVGRTAPPKTTLPTTTVQEKKMFYVYTGSDGLDWGTDLVVRFPFETQEDKSNWITLVQKVSGTQVTRIELTEAEQETLFAIGVGL